MPGVHNYTPFRKPRHLLAGYLYVYPPKPVLSNIEGFIWGVIPAKESISQFFILNSSFSIH
jgi:hypothetical protein